MCKSHYEEGFAWKIGPHFILKTKCIRNSLWLFALRQGFLFAFARLLLSRPGLCCEEVSQRRVRARETNKKKKKKIEKKKRRKEGNFFKFVEQGLKIQIETCSGENSNSWCNWQGALFSY